MLGGLKVVEGRVVLLTEVEELGVAGLELGVVRPEVELGLFGVRGDRRLAGHLLPAAVADVHGVGHSERPRGAWRALSSSPPAKGEGAMGRDGVVMYGA